MTPLHFGKIHIISERRLRQYEAREQIAKDSHLTEDHLRPHQAFLAELTGETIDVQNDALARPIRLPNGKAVVFTDTEDSADLTTFKTLVRAGFDAIKADYPMFDGFSVALLKKDELAQAAAIKMLSTAAENRINRIV